MTNPSEPSSAHDDQKEMGTNTDPLATNSQEKSENLYRRSVFRLVITAVLFCGVIGLLKGYEIKGALTRTQKYIFNALSLLLTLFLGMNMTIAHSKIIYFIREGIIYNRKVDITQWGKKQLQKFHQVTGLRSICTLVYYIAGPETGPCPGGSFVISMFILVWLFLNLSVAIAISLIGLTYSLEDGAIGHHLRGNISIADTGRFSLSPNDEEILDITVETFISRLYADVSISYKEEKYNNKPPLEEKDDKYLLEEKVDGWMYNFRQSDPAEQVVTRSKRYIQTTATCQAFTIESYDQQNLELEYTSQNGIQTMSGVLTSSGTTYMSPQYVYSSPYEWYNNIAMCGPRCGMLIVTQIANISKPQGQWLYFCNSTVQNVTDAHTQVEEIGDAVALIASTSLYQSGFIDWGERYIGYYPDRTPFGTLVDGDAARMAHIIARGSAGCIAALDQLNPRVYSVLGSEPWVGVRLKVKWLRLTGVLVAIFGIQLVITLGAIFWHHKKKPKSEPQPLDTLPETS